MYKITKTANYNIKKVIIATLVLMMSLTIFPKSIFGSLIRSFPETVIEWSNTEQYIKEKERFNWEAVSTLSDLDNSTVIVVIGETTRGDHMSINGYERNTTPLLSEENIISYPKAVSIGSHTLMSTPYIFTMKPVETYWSSKLFPEKSFISAFKEAGYETYYISYLSNVHYGDNAINQIVNEADFYIQREDGFDENGVKNIEEILSESKAKKKLIIYKLIGSHLDFQDRYPDEFDIFKPSFKSVEYKTDDIGLKDVCINTYDNSILYTDYVVNHIIEVLKKQEGDVTLSFVSDHGINIYDDNQHLNNGFTRANYDIPMFFWLNEKAQNRLGAENINMLRCNTSFLVDQTYFIGTLFHLNGIVTSKTISKDLFHPVKNDMIKVVQGNDVIEYSQVK